MRSPLVLAAADFINKTVRVRCNNCSADFEGEANREGRWLVTRIEPGYFDDEDITRFSVNLSTKPVSQVFIDEVFAEVWSRSIVPFEKVLDEESLREFYATDEEIVNLAKRLGFEPKEETE